MHACLDRAQTNGHAFDNVRPIFCEHAWTMLNLYVPMLAENGPYVVKRVSGVLKLVRVESSWINVANMLFIDSPVGTGLTYSTVGLQRGVKDYMHWRGDSCWI